MDPEDYRVLELPFPSVHCDKDGILFVLRTETKSW